jgi:GH25 family lysozyme M1 (1,4-beta-N-acetylmuramidase)
MKQNRLPIPSRAPRLAPHRSPRRAARNKAALKQLLAERLARAASKLAFCACALVLTCALAACNPFSRVSFDSLELPGEAAYTSPYDWSGLSYQNGRFCYSEGGERLSRLGIDVSSHQGSIQWPAVAADGIDFAFIRVGNRGFTEGQLYLDERFEQNYQGATEAGLSVGAYFFSQALNEDEARAEARFVLEHLAGRVLSYPIVYDFEPVQDTNGRANHVSAHQRTSNALAFCQTVEAAGYQTMLYGNAKDISQYYLEVLRGHNIWFAEYDASYPSGQFDFTIWQYSNAGQVAGIATNVDMNIELIHVERDA